MIDTARIEAARGVHTQSTASAREALAQRLAWEKLDEKKALAEVDKVCPDAESHQALVRRIGELRRARELQPIAAKVFEFAATSQRLGAKYSADREAFEAKARRGLVAWVDHPSPVPHREALSAAHAAHAALAELLQLVGPAVSAAYREADQALGVARSAPLHLRQEIADRPEKAQALALAIESERRRVARAIDAQVTERETSPPASRVQELQAELAALPTVKALEAQIAAAPKTLAAAEAAHARAFAALIRWGQS